MVVKLDLALREEYRVRVFDNRELRGIYGPKRDCRATGLEKTHNEELRTLYSSPNIIRMLKSISIRWEGHVARMDKRNSCRRLV
jgi:hypothetical protein